MSALANKVNIYIKAAATYLYLKSIATFTEPATVLTTLDIGLGYEIYKEFQAGDARKCNE